MTGIGANVTGNVVTVFWDPLSENEWNGIPLGYYIYVSDVYYPEIYILYMYYVYTCVCI